MALIAVIPQGREVCSILGHLYVTVWGILVCPICWRAILIPPP